MYKKKEILIPVPCCEVDGDPRILVQPIGCFSQNCKTQFFMLYLNRVYNNNIENINKKFIFYERGQ